MLDSADGPADASFMRLALAMLVVAVVVTGCGHACACTPTPAPLPTPQGAITKEAAIAAALAVAPQSISQVTAVSANVGHDPVADSPALVWLVELHGDFDPASCPPDNERQLETIVPPCQLDDGWLTAVLDVFTGQLIGWENYPTNPF